jgi:hypothetical protein
MKKRPALNSTRRLKLLGNREERRMATKKTDKSSKNNPRKGGGYTDATEKQPEPLKASIAEHVNAKTELPLAPEVRVENFREKLKCKLTAFELAEKSDRAAHLGGQIAQATASMKATQARLAGKIKQLQSERSKLDSDIRDKTEYRYVDCQRVYDYRLQQVREVRTDTGDAVSEPRPMNNAECQMELGLQRQQSDEVKDGGTLTDLTTGKVNDLPPLDDDEDPEPFF